MTEINDTTTRTVTAEEFARVTGNVLQGPGSSEELFDSKTVSGEVLSASAR